LTDVRPGSILGEVLTKASRRRQRKRDIARMTLGAIRFVNGTAALVAPSFVAGRLGVARPASDPSFYPWRLFGVRTAIIGADLWLAPRAERDRAMRFALLIHGSDTIAALIAAAREELPRRQALTTAALSATNTALAVIAQP
jgi:hypothetical protein